MSWNTKTLEGMEETCKEEQESNCNKKINGNWLEVMFRHNQYYYYYGVKEITRNQALQLFKDAQ